MVSTPPKSDLENDVEFGKNSDIKFIFPYNGGATLLAEKHLLMKESDVFKKQFASSANDNGETEENERVVVTDISFNIFSVFSKFIKHIYETEEATLDINEENYLELLYLARKYFVNDLTYMVIKFLQQFLNPDNLPEHFQCIEKFEIKMLNDQIRKVAVSDPLKVISKMSNSTPHMLLLEIILQSPVLPCTEFELCHAILKMMNRKYHSGEKIRKDLGKLIYLIRFPTMAVHELISCAIPSSFLTNKEIVDFLLWAQYEIYTDSLQFFSTVPRII